MQFNCSYTDLVELHKLVPNPRNTNVHPKEQINLLAKIIDYQGQRVPIVVSKRSGFMTKGHARLLALKKLKWEKAAVDMQDYESEAQEYADLEADNRIAELSHRDEDKFKTNLSEIYNDNFDLQLFGIKSLSISIADEKEGLTEDDSVPETSKQNELGVLAGDIWELGTHRLMCGDSTDINNVEKVADGIPVDLLVTDPPYNVDYTGGGKEKLKIKNDKFKSSDDFRVFLSSAFNSANVIMKNGACFYIWHVDSEGYAFRGACADAGWKVRQCLVWQKDALVLGRQDYHWKHEPCLYGWKEGASHFWGGDRKQSTVLNFDRPRSSKIHPTMKPVALIKYQILNNTKDGDYVLDLFAGSGTTLIACEKIARRFIGLELDPHYCSVIIKRWQMFTGQTARRLDGK